MKTKKWLQNYYEIREIAEGGNAKVYEVNRKSDGVEFALKEQTQLKPEKKHRFKNEIEIVLKEQGNCSGILPICEYSADDNNGFWYTMPIAQPIKHFLCNKSLDIIINAIIEIAETLKYLHSRQISHRDIKPDNIFYFNGHFCLGDFGLVNYPESEDLTKTKSHLGAWSTMAPEMKRNPKYSDGTKADVYSLAKTLWMLRNKNYTGFDGEYDFLNKSISLAQTEESIVEIHELLTDSTKNNPDERPDINTFCERLKKWLNEKDNWELTQQKEWAFVTKQLFIIPPKRASWTSRNEIIKILNIIGKTHELSHMFYPDSGGFDLYETCEAFEDGYIFINNEVLLKPKTLSLETFRENVSWNYFFLEIDESFQVDPNNENDTNETVAALPNGKYVAGDGIFYGVYDYDSGEKLPDGYKIINKYNKGNFLFVLKSGPYNKITATYDARHGFCDSDNFKNYIEKLKNMYDILIDKGCDSEIILKLPAFSENPFKQKIKSYTPSNNTLPDIPDDFIKNEYSKWNFKHYIQNVNSNPNCPAKFLIEFNESPGGIPNLLNDKNKYLSRDGKIRELSQSDNQKSEILFFDNKQTAMEVCEKCRKHFEILCAEKGFSSFYNYFNVEMNRNFEIIPSHLFSKEEIKQLMYEADDRKHNRLVIDENGYAKIIQSEDNYFLYPVRNSQWDAGNHYVGKYANLSDSDINEVYKRCLWGWLTYLETGTSQYTSDLYYKENLEIILEKIQNFYSNE